LPPRIENSGNSEGGRDGQRRRRRS